VKTREPWEERNARSCDDSVKGRSYSLNIVGGGENIGPSCLERCLIGDKPLTQTEEKCAEKEYIKRTGEEKGRKSHGEGEKKGEEKFDVTN